MGIKDLLFGAPDDGVDLYVNGKKVKKSKKVKLYQLIGVKAVADALKAHKAAVASKVEEKAAP